MLTLAYNISINNLTKNIMQKKTISKEKLAKRQNLIKQMQENEPSEEVVNKLGYVSIDGHNYSARNKFFLKLQGVEFGRLAGFRQWLKHGRKVKKGEHGHDIMIPITRESKDKKGKVLESETYFKWMTLFHEKQTEEV